VDLIRHGTHPGVVDPALDVGPEQRGGIQRPALAVRRRNAGGDHIVLQHCKKLHSPNESGTSTRCKTLPLEALETCRNGAVAGRDCIQNFT